MKRLDGRLRNKMKITYVGDGYKVTADEADLSISFVAKNIEEAKKHYLDIIGEKFDNAVNMGLLDPNVMNWKGVPLPEQSCVDIINC
jgi:hypothetical protein